MQPGRIRLDNPVFAGTLRRSSRSVIYDRRELQAATVQDIVAVRTQPAVKRPTLQTQRQPRPNLQHLRPKPAAAPVLHTTQPEAVSQNSKAQAKKPRHQMIVFYTLAALLFVAGGYIAYDGWRANHKVAAQVKELQKKATTAANNDESAAPSTDKPSATDIKSYAVAPNLPRYVDIAKLGVHARVMSMSVDRKNELQAPTNVHNAGWYNASAQPGQTGAMLVDGHSGIGNYKGIFHDIGTLAAGDVITVTRGDGAKFDYQVVRTETVDAAKVNMASLLVSADTARPGLNLITCAGDQLPGTYQLAQRTIVYAVMR